MDDATNTLQNLEMVASSVTELQPAGYKETMSSLPSGITVVSTWGENGRPVGAAVQSVMSVSLNPELLLISLGTASRTLEHVRRREEFMVNVLGGLEGERVAKVFASTSDHKFNSVQWSRHGHVLACPALSTGTVARLECKLVRSILQADHWLLIGEVLASAVRKERPLVYASRQFLLL